MQAQSVIAALQSGDTMGELDHVPYDICTRASRYPMGSIAVASTRLAPNECSDSDLLIQGGLAEPRFC